MILGIGLNEKIFFTQNLEVMLRAGLSISVAIDTLLRQTDNGKLKKIFQSLKEDVEKGVALSSSLEKWPDVFSELFISMIRAGEVSGSLELILKNITLELKKEHELRSKVVNAMIYPCIVVASMILIGAAMLAFVIPKFSSIFLELNVELPLPTKILIAFSQSIIQYGLMLTSSFVIVLGTFLISLKRKKGKFFWHNVFLYLPILKGIIKRFNLAKFTRVLSSLLKADVPIAQSFAVSANTLGNAVYKDAVSQLVPDITRGIRVGLAMSKHPRLFPPLVIQMVSVGEETGALSQILEELAIFYEEEVDNIMKRLPSIIEPLLMIFLGFGIGGMAISIILPMYKLAQNV